MDKPLIDGSAQVLAAFAWPLVVFLTVLLFRVPIAARLRDVKSVRGPAGTGVDFELVQRIVKEGQAENLGADEITQRIQQAVSDKHQLRILRALLDEEDGRWLMHYQEGDYKPAMEKLLRKGLVRRTGPKFYLTEPGFTALRSNLLPILKISSDKPNASDR